MVWADAGIFFIFFFGDKVFATVTIPTFVSFGIDIVFEFFPDEFNAAFVVFIGCANKIGRMDV